MDPSSSIIRKGRSCWTKRRQVRENTEQQMAKVRVCLQKKKEKSQRLMLLFAKILLQKIYQTKKQNRIRI